MLSIEDPTSLFDGLDLIEQREQEVKAHIGQVSYEGLHSPILLSQDMSGGCGGKIWEAANVMIDYLIWKNAQLEGQLFKDQTVIEVGAGTGLVGIAIAKICSHVHQVIITDQLPMMDLMVENIQLNQLNSVVSPAILDWGTEITNSSLLNADVIIASDCIYLEVAFIPLFDTLLALTTNPNTIIYLSYRKRRKADKRFFQLARKKFVFETVEDDPRHAVYSKVGLHLYVVKRKQAP
ncbi:putative methyltransferase-domain-containing protein [Choanephora cucurbitarum]|nr:putative methyltransferase-domain-containing protein [Choanephora cucurbitarum]